VFERRRETTKRETDKHRESEESKRYRERDSSRNRSYHAGTHAREKEIRKRELPVLPSRRSSPQNAHQRTEQNRTYAPRLELFFSRNPLPPASLAPFSSMCACVQARQTKERKDNFSLVVSHSSRSLTSLSLSHGSAAPYGPSRAVANRVFPTQEP